MSSLKTVIIVGTWHHIQEGRTVFGTTDDDLRNFEALLRAVIRAHHVVAVAEEISADRLDDIAGDTLVSRIATSLALPYRYCDLTAAERQARGIPILAPKHGPGAHHHRAVREAAWRDGLVALDRWPVLFVCGGEHSRTFADMLTASGITVVHEERWPRGWVPQSSESDTAY